MTVHKTLALAALAAILVWGTAASDDEGIKIGVVDIEQAISSTEAGKAAREEFGRKQREAEAKVQPMLDRYRALEEELKTKKFVLSDDALYQKQLDLAELRNEIQAKMREIEGQLQVDQKRLEGPLVQKLEGIIEAHATPMSYMSSKSGKQYVLITVPNPSWSYPRPPQSEDPTDDQGGYVIAYALPDAPAQ
jgi:Skp family chaperone for outer membrane proteins